MDRKTERENIKRLYDAAAKGSVETLNELIEKVPFILNTISLTSFSETPLHISALLGHLEFTNEILKQNPNMATKLDSLRRSPLHLASAEGHAYVVKCLLSVNADLCLVPDQDGRTPLHLAAMRGQIEVIRELFYKEQKSASVLLDGDTVLHLCVEYNHLDALKLLVDMFKDADAGLLIKGNKDGNTILHLAAKLNQFETTRYLLSLDHVKVSVNSLNAAGLTAMDVIIETCSRRSFRSFQIQETLMENGAIRASSYSADKQNTDIITEAIKPRVSAADTVSNNNNNNNNPPTSISKKNNPPTKSTKALVLGWIFRILTQSEHWKTQDLGTLMIVATVIATITFQFATNPPGGVWEQNHKDNTAGFFCSEDVPCEAGTSILSYTYYDDYMNFMTYNMMAFLASLSVILLIISGMPIENKVATWILTLAMCASLTFLVLACLKSLYLVSPGGFGHRLSRRIIRSVYLWLSFVGIVAVVHVIRILFWAPYKLRNYLVKKKNKSEASQKEATSEPQVEERNSTTQCGPASV